MLEQLIRMPLFPRKKTFCTRLPIHVRLRRPDAARDECASVTMSVITAEAYRTVGYDVRRCALEPCTSRLTGERLLTSGPLLWSRPSRRSRRARSRRPPATCTSRTAWTSSSAASQARYTRDLGEI